MAAARRKNRTQECSVSKRWADRMSKDHRVVLTCDEEAGEGQAIETAADAHLGPIVLRISEPMVGRDDTIVPLPDRVDTIRVIDGDGDTISACDFGVDFFETVQDVASVGFTVILVDFLRAGREIHRCTNRSDRDDLSIQIERGVTKRHMASE